MHRTDSRTFIRNTFPHLRGLKTTTSRRYQKESRGGFLDNWWFKFNSLDVEQNDSIVFAGALDEHNERFRVFRVPSAYISENIGKLYRSDRGWVIIYLHFDTHRDLRNPAGVEFRQFCLNPDDALL